MIRTRWFRRGTSAWHSQPGGRAEKGETYSPPSNEVIGKAVVAMNDPLIATGPELKVREPPVLRRHRPEL